MERTTLFADVLLPLALPGYYTYRIPFEMNDQVMPGQRVSVQFGKKKIYTALVRRVHEKAPNLGMVKYILSVVDEYPIISEKQYEFWEWMASYYMCTPGEVMNAALPSALKLQSETKVAMNPAFEGDVTGLSEKEFLVLEALHKKNGLTVTEISEIVSLQNVMNIIKNLFEKGVIIPEEELVDKYKPRTETLVKLTDDFLNRTDQKEVFDKLEKKAPKQLEILIYLYDRHMHSREKDKRITRSELLKKLDVSASQLNALIKKGICETLTSQITRLEHFEGSLHKIKLNKYQEQALSEIHEGFANKDVVLLHGITSSGKTEVYIRLIEETLKQGKQVLYLLPEIALTTQIINRLRKVFGNSVGVYHSRFNDAEKVEIWNKVLDSNLATDEGHSGFNIVLGARSAVFLPLSKPGLIIVDEEHDSSYKQYDPSPRYNARDSAIVLASRFGAKVILGSATPSVESYYNAQCEKYHLVELKKRHSGVQLPEILVSDVKDEMKHKRMKSHFSPLLIDHIADALSHKEQVILFQNRRGFSLHLECDICHWVPVCINCDVTLTYHKSADQLRCHYCGYSTHVPAECPACGNNRIIMRGYGTEKIEEELPIFFPDVRVSRMDLDTTRSKNSYQQIINDFEDRKIDILVGTQMVTKGLDFDNVSFVGIMNADNMMNFPDFRAHERCYQLMSQVSGRAGRSAKRGKVIIQTYNPDHFIIRCVIDQNYSEMYQNQLLERMNYKYPPFYRLIEMLVKHRDPKVLDKAAAELAHSLRSRFGNRVLGPEYPMVGRIRNEYLKKIMIKLEKGIALKESKSIISNTIQSLRAEPCYKQLRVHIDVDPY
jgi:primosomal protein N' (replication factor Y) (superfamily II helicase)